MTIPLPEAFTHKTLLPGSSVYGTSACVPVGLLVYWTWHKHNCIDCCSIGSDFYLFTANGWASGISVHIQSQLLTVSLVVDLGEGGSGLVWTVQYSGEIWHNGRDKQVSDVDMSHIET